VAEQCRLQGKAAACCAMGVNTGNGVHRYRLVHGRVQHEDDTFGRKAFQRRIGQRQR